MIVKALRFRTAYNANGNTLSKSNGSGTTTYGWDFENRLSSVALPGTGGTARFKYDPSGEESKSRGLSA
jgi:YD repeat-containing protein